MLALPVFNPGELARLCGILVDLEERAFRFLNDFLVHGAEGLEKLGDVLRADVHGDLEGDAFGRHFGVEDNLFCSFTESLYSNPVDAGYFILWSVTGDSKLMSQLGCL